MEGISNRKDEIFEPSEPMKPNETDLNSENSKFKSQINTGDVKNKTSILREKFEQKQKLDEKIETILSNYFKNLTLNK